MLATITNWMLANNIANTTCMGLLCHRIIVLTCTYDAPQLWALFDSSNTSTNPFPHFPPFFHIPQTKAWWNVLVDRKKVKLSMA
jgi:hypothetical protein